MIAVLPDKLLLGSPEVALAAPPDVPAVYVDPAHNKNLSSIYSQVPPNNVPGFTLLIVI